MARGIELVVGLKVPDNEARSALEALSVKMGLGDAVSDLAREDLWVFEFAREAGDARSAVERLVRETNVFANPNKHRYEIAEEGAGGFGLDSDEVAILVRDRDSDWHASILPVLRRLGISGVEDVHRWTRWRVRLRAPARPDDSGTVALLRRIAVTTSRHDGLLSNPHSQIARAVLPGGAEKPLEP